jgi:Holliday junction resolvase
VTNYARGRRYEWEVRDHLLSEGYSPVLRTAGSKGAVDLIAFKPGELLLVQVKGNGVLAPTPWNALFDCAQMCGAIPILAERRPGRTAITYYRLLARKDRPGRQPFTFFELDRVGTR